MKERVQIKYNDKKIIKKLDKREQIKIELERGTESKPKKGSNTQRNK